MALLADEQLPRNTALTVTARTLFTSLFFLSGITHFTNIPYYQDLMPDNVPYSLFWILISGVVELAGAAMILFNWRACLGGWLLVAFLLPVTFVVHGYEMIYAESEIMRAMQQAHFLKGIALTGAALLITQLGASRETAS